MVYYDSNILSQRRSVRGRVLVAQRLLCIFSVPHIGHLYSLVTADIFARYNALKNTSRPVYFMTGTDEHGLKIQKAALDKGLSPKEFCDSISQQFRVCFRFSDWLILVLIMECFQRLATEADVGFTRFLRTSEEAHYASVEHIWVCRGGSL